MKKTCACCEGIHKSTPAQIANRPGLLALSYRVGTHATFLETMKARLSNFYLEDDEPRGRRLAAKIYPLSELATRDSDDPAIAMLDAWAIVADVLTFYQERIANEGYLRTATERRSVLELARLVGYALRPGVAASTYLAYTLDKDTAITIPAGSRAQSVPGPGETLQAFETSEDLLARTEWNLLQPRLTRPQFPDKREKVDDKALYFKGTSTNLKQNDAILVDFGGLNSEPALYRVMKVEPDAVAERTKVTLQPWVRESKTLKKATFSEAQTEGFSSTVSASLPQLRVREDVVQEIIERNSNKEQFGDLLKTRTGSKVLELLDSLRSGSPPASDVELAQLMNEHVLPALKDELRLAQEGRFTRLSPWIEQLVLELEDAIESVPASEEKGTLNDFAAEDNFSVSSSGSDPDADDSSTMEAADEKGKTGMEHLLDLLEKPASIPPANQTRLERSLEKSFSGDSDILPKLLTTLRPALAPLLTKAIGNLPATRPTTAKVYAMRTRASVFGHNAPMQNVTGENGKVTGQKEWTLTRLGETGREDFLLEVKIIIRRGRTPGSPPDRPTGSPPSNELNQASFRTKIKIGAFKEIVHPSLTKGEPLLPHDFEINYDEAGEKHIKGNVAVPLPPPGTGQAVGLPPCILTFNLELRPISVKIDFSDFTQPNVTCTGIDPSTLKLMFSVPTNSPVTGIAATEAGLTLTISGKGLSAETQPTETANIVSLDAPYPQILPSVNDRRDAPQSWVVLERPDPPNQSPRVIISRALQVQEASRADYGIALKSTQLTLEEDWINPAADDFRVIRGSTVFAQSELLELAEAPLDPLANAVCGGEIELDGFYSGLEAGRWLVITGERADITPSEPPKPKPLPEKAKPAEVKPATGMETELEPEQEKEPEKSPVIGGLKSAELVMLAGLRHNGSSNDKMSTTLLLANELAYCYKLDTVRIYGNVVHATHGETRSEVLGSGDASQPLQSFTLKQPPLTFVSAPTVNGTDTTLKVRVNDILWRERESLAELGPKDRCYLTRTDDEGKTKVIFGNGVKGARPATGIENITALYRNGIGRAGNLKAEQISLLATKPLGVKDVINPLPATGGADKEDRDTARRNTPLAVMSLDRLVSVQDYEDFTRTFAGIGKASAARLSDGRRQTVFLTIAGADDIPIAETSDLFQNLRLALHNFGDPFQAVQIKKRLLKLLVLSANVRVHPDYLWEKVEPKVRDALLDRFSFARRDLGQDALLSEAVSAMQMVEGVLYVDVDSFGAVDESIASAELPDLLETFQKNVQKGRVIAEMAKVDETVTEPDKRIRPAELILMSPKVTDMLILKEVKA
jgi:baseplate J-like protein